MVDLHQASCPYSFCNPNLSVRVPVPEESDLVRSDTKAEGDLCANKLTNYFPFEQLSRVAKAKAFPDQCALSRLIHLFGHLSSEWKQGSKSPIPLRHFMLRLKMGVYVNYIYDKLVKMISTISWNLCKSDRSSSSTPRALFVGENSKGVISSVRLSLVTGKEPGIDTARRISQSGERWYIIPGFSKHFRAGHIRGVTSC